MSAPHLMSFAAPRDRVRELLARSPAYRALDRRVRRSLREVAATLDDRADDVRRGARRGVRRAADGATELVRRSRHRIRRRPLTSFAVALAGGIALGALGALGAAATLAPGRTRGYLARAQRSRRAD